MKTVKDKHILVGADFAGFPLKEAVVAHLKAKGWTVTHVGVKADSDPDDTEPKCKFYFCIRGKGEMIYSVAK